MSSDTRAPSTAEEGDRARHAGGTAGATGGSGARGAASTGRLILLLGPALVAGVAYLDPGNVASNMSAGARYGYLLVWVVVGANLIAWLVQYLSAKLGLVTGESLPSILGQRLRSPWARRAYWLQAEVVAMATDVAEIVGGAIALNLLFGLPLLAGGFITGAVSLLLLALHGSGRGRSFERIVIGLVAIIGIGFCAGVVVAPPSAGGVLAGLVPRFADADSVLLAASVLGATVMPHAIYAHSALTRDRFGAVEPARLPRVLRATRIDVTVALAIAGTINVAILVLAAATLQGVGGTETLEGAHAALRDALGPVVATLFAVGLLASGLASSSVGAYAGAEIMRGLLRVRIPLLARRAVTLIPALAIIASGVEPTLALVISQVVLSFGIPFALIPLAVLTARRSVLGGAVNRWWTTVLAVAAVALLSALNVVLVVLLLAGG
ncbi:Nramp family divalent metal transporter [Schumannella luteola]|uniref:Manganese transport protein n=1 Tax=Schumannella luteola TaxID=472059 RepID=A0A852YK66_9MICO|nr:Nramp family divalent metal transporter [Schumannella luteola]NYG99568.1 manganese transport protein [Schumannella luteola]TPX01976.1 Mn(2+) uptake NRAMP transporter MntH [Schumannella luteola]